MEIRPPVMLDMETSMAVALATVVWERQSIKPPEGWMPVDPAHFDVGRKQGEGGSRCHFT